MRMDLGKSAQSECSHMSPCLAHCVGIDAKIAVLHPCVRDSEGGDDTVAIATNHAIEVTYLLHAARVFRELVEHDGPDVVGNGNHAGGPL